MRSFSTLICLPLLLIGMPLMVYGDPNQPTSHSQHNGGDHTHGNYQQDNYDQHNNDRANDREGFRQEERPTLYDENRAAIQENIQHETNHGGCRGGQCDWHFGHEDRYYHDGRYFPPSTDYSYPN